MHLLVREPFTMEGFYRRSLLALCLTAWLPLSAQQPPQANALPAHPFFIKNTWIIGGAGPWDYLTMDSKAERLYIAHGPVVQVVDVKSGTVAGQIGGLHEAHAIVLDEGGEFGYVSDGPANAVKVFDPRTFEIVGTIATGPMPRALVLDAQSGLMFAICTDPIVESQPPATDPSQRPGQQNTARPAAPREIKTSISVIDVTARRRLGQILMPGKLGFAQSDGNGQIFALLVDRDQVVRLDASAIAALLHAQPAGAASNPPPVADGTPSSAGAEAQNSAKQQPGTTILDWSHERQEPAAAQDAMRFFPLGSACHDPLSLAVDGTHQRIFAACNNMKLMVLNAGSGEVVTSLAIGPGADAVGFDAGRGLIYTANGDAQGTLTIIHQDVTDTYSEIQNLATRRRARTLAVDPETGQVYLVTDFMGVDLAHQGGIGGLRSAPVAGSFQVLVIGP
jgi:DNA-binding beta-propeller fold protein YncE